MQRRERIEQAATLLNTNPMRLFVYGTLKRGHALHSHLEKQMFLGVGQTLPEFRLVKCSWYPAMVDTPNGRSIRGEVWEVEEATIQHLDIVEDVASGLYERRLISLLPPFDDAPSIAYVYLRETRGMPDCGEEWHSPID